MKYMVSRLWPKYIGERRTTFAKAYGIKVRYYGEQCWGTHWEPGKNEKKILPPEKKIKRKKK